MLCTNCKGSTFEYRETVYSDDHGNTIRNHQLRCGTCKRTYEDTTVENEIREGSFRPIIEVK